MGEPEAHIAGQRENFGNAEVDQHSFMRVFRVFDDHDIAWLEVAMDNASVVGMRECIRHFNDIFEGKLGNDVAFLDKLTQGQTLKIVHHHKGNPLAGNGKFAHRHYVWMAEAACCSGFGHKPFIHDFVRTGVCQKHLYGHVFLALCRLSVDAAVDDAHAASADFVQQLIAFAEL
ncbi:MAG: hypothetical protein BWY75_02598 [bacterium ADurb.Bin425]|nr:MAG: hypothetical protein BWY75_02598 [bacterium ADurb.Bin425]